MEDFAKGPSCSSLSNAANGSGSNSLDKIEVVTHWGEELSRSDGRPKQQRRIEKVPLILRSDKRNEGCYDPKVVSVGPYHHGKHNLQEAEKIKPRLAQMFVSRRIMDELRQKIRDKIDDARSFYVDGSTDKYSDQAFTEMMLLDACLVLAFIERDEATRGEIITSLGMQAFYALSSDILYLLENQLPFLVLEIVMSLKFQGNEWMDVLDIFSAMASFGVEEHNKNAKAREICKKQPLHLIEYFWLRERAFDEPNNTLKSRSSTARISATQSINEFMCPFSVSGLKRMGIHVRPTSIRSRNRVEFTSFFFFGVLKLPPLFFSPEWIVRSSNQVAYELGLNDHDNLPTIAYLNFMKLLINLPDDVKELRSKAILFTTFSSDEEVVEKFSGIITAPKDFSIYDEAKEKIEMFYYHNKWKAWTAELQHNHFSSPWKFIGFLAATSLLVMTFLQTYFTMYPRLFGALRAVLGAPRSHKSVGVYAQFREKEEHCSWSTAPGAQNNFSS